MSDPHQANTWPPPWALPPDAPPQPAAAPPTPLPPAPPPPPVPTVPSQRNAGPARGAGGEAPPANVWPNYQLPPDMVTPEPVSVAPTSAGNRLPPYPPPGAVPTAAASGSPRPTLVAGAAALAAMVAVAATVLIVQPWASSDARGTGITTYTADPPTYAAPTTSNRRQLAATDPGASLRQQTAEDGSLVADIPDGYWVPQLSSKRVGLVADGISYTEQTIWNDHYTVRSTNPGAALLWSGDYTTFKNSDFWVTIMPTAYSSTAEGANSWCASRRFNGEHCFAKRISSTTYYDHTTENR